MNPSGDNGSGASRRDWLVVAFLAEFAALLIGLLMPIAPNKTGSSSSWVDHFVFDPTYLEKAVFWFVFSNLAFGLIGLVVWVSRLRR